MISLLSSRRKVSLTEKFEATSVKTAAYLFVQLPQPRFELNEFLVKFNGVPVIREFKIITVQTDFVPLTVNK